MFAYQKPIDSFLIFLMLIKLPTMRRNKIKYGNKISRRQTDEDPEEIYVSCHGNNET